MVTFAEGTTGGRQGVSLWPRGFSLLSSRSGSPWVVADPSPPWCLSVKQFDYEAVANRLFEAASQQSTPSLNRKRLYKVIRK